MLRNFHTYAPHCECTSSHAKNQIETTRTDASKIQSEPNSCGKSDSRRSHLNLEIGRNSLSLSLLHFFAHTAVVAFVFRLRDVVGTCLFYFCSFCVLCGLKIRDPPKFALYTIALCVCALYLFILFPTEYV